MSKYVFSDEEYGDVLNNFVIGCVDVAVCYKGKILLETRTDNPIKDEWWIFGGRIQRNEDLNAAASRGVYRELGVKLPRERYSVIGVYNLIWPVRREPDELNGCHHLLIAHHVELSHREYIDVNEFVATSSMTAKWFDFKEIVDGRFLNEIKDITFKSSQQY